MNRKHMVRTILAGLLLALFWLPANLPAAEAPALVSVEWLAANLDRKDLVILDVSEFIHFEKKHIPGAVKGFGPWMTMNREYVGFMMPETGELVDMIRGFGIDKDSFVVIYDEGTSSADTAKSARALWTLHVLGHDRVAILDGGFAAWLDEEQPVTDKAAVPVTGNFTGTPSPEKLAGLDDVRAALASDAIYLVDTRNPDQYFGHEKKSEISRSGHLPGALLLPEAYLTIAGEDFSPSLFRDLDELKAMAAGIHLPADRQTEIITYSNHGLSAALGYFMLHDLLGYTNVKVYDGSILEAAEVKDIPMVANRWAWAN